MAEQLPIWQALGVEPPSSLVTNGWQPGMKPSAQHMNWLFNRIYKCLEEIQAGGGTEELEQELAALQQVVAMHLADNVRHITEAERTNWNNKVSSNVAMATEEDPNTTTKSLILTNHENAAFPNDYTYVRTVFYGDGKQKSQIATSHWNTARMAFRTCVANVWTPWRRVLDESTRNVPNGFAGLDGSGKLLDSVIPTTVRKTTSGTYMGVGSPAVAPGRLINVGFEPSLVIVFGTRTDGIPSEVSIISSGGQITPSVGNNPGYQKSDVSQTKPTGFTVVSSHGDSVNVNYKYTAFQ